MRVFYKPLPGLCKTKPARCPSIYPMRVRAHTLLAALIFLGAFRTHLASAAPVDFSLQIRPLLSEKCFFCHGPDEKHREAKLRLDEEAPAKAVRDGTAAIVPGSLEKSEAWQRIIAENEDDLMPPSESHRPLSSAQKDLIKRWIEQGAPWGKHWAFESLRAPALKPEAAIDTLVRAGLQKQAPGLSPAPRAGWHILARRLSLDLTGLPPTPEQADALAANAAKNSASALSAYVDGLLASKRFGEHWARLWLDLARYADTKGYEKDLNRDIWLYRDWVINALNADMPFDEFTIEQIAGDLLPGATQDQIVATAFHRNTMTNDEGGTDNEEFRVTAVKDRVDTTLQVWMGLTAGCAKCHSHKYDPITQLDYYRLYAVFNQTEDADLPSDAPLLSLPTRDQKDAQAKAQEVLTAAQKKLAEARKADPKASAGNQVQPEDGPEVAAAKKEVQATNDKLKAVRDKILSVPVMKELVGDKRRVSKVHNRGNFLDQTDVVEPAVLTALTPMPADAKADRLGLAKWLVDKDNPLTPRVMVNRVWARLFGIGLVETEEDFGSQGMLPSHPELLDWLALHYRDDCRWSLKKLLKTIVLSGTYQQSFLLDARRKELDPRNTLLSRGPRFRLTAEMVRDQALCISGLLSDKVGGKSVMPPQPDGLWKSTYNTMKWVNATDEDRFRRGLYTYWKRTTPYPSMVAFDAGSREVCQVRRIHTNTPLQALVTMNDPAYLETAAALARQMIRAGDDPRQRAERGLRLALIRSVKPAEVDAVVEACTAAKEEYQGDAASAATFLQQANTSATKGERADELAAWTVAASVILNLDELVTRN